MTAAMSRGAPVPAALVAGAVVVLAVVALAGASLGGGTWWAVGAGAFACASGLVLGLTRRVVPAAALGLVAVVAGVVAAGDDGRGREAAPPVRHEIVRPAGEDRAAGQASGVGIEGGGEKAPAARRDGREAAPPAIMAPGDDEGVAAGGGPKALVRSYYAALDAHEYAVAWRRLSPSVQASFGGFDSWRRGYGTTLGHRLEDVQVDGDSLRLVLVATDRTPCGGTTEQRFTVQWQLAGRKAVALTAARLGGVDPAAACG